MGALIFPVKGIRWGKKAHRMALCKSPNPFRQRDSGTFVSNDLENNRLLVINFCHPLGRELNSLSTITEKGGNSIATIFNFIKASNCS